VKKWLRWLRSQLEPSLTTGDRTEKIFLFESAVTH
jgi:hypothetical protein